jgi:hypothetical protein
MKYEIELSEAQIELLTGILKDGTWMHTAENQDADFLNYEEQEILQGIADLFLREVQP